MKSVAIGSICMDGEAQVWSCLQQQWKSAR